MVSKSPEYGEPCVCGLFCEEKTDGYWHGMEFESSKQRRNLLLKNSEVVFLCKDFKIGFLSDVAFKTMEMC